MGEVINHDLTPTVGKFLDVHLVIPLLEFLSTRNLFPKEDLEKSKLSVLFKTNMLDLAFDIYKALHGTKEVPSNMMARRDEVMATMQALTEEVKPILELVRDQGRVAELKQERCFNQAYLQQQLNISSQQIEVLQRYSKFIFECGDYRTAADLLLNYRLLTCARSRARAPLQPLSSPSPAPLRARHKPHTPSPAACGTRHCPRRTPRSGSSAAS